MSLFAIIFINVVAELTCRTVGNFTLVYCQFQSSNLLISTALFLCYIHVFIVQISGRVAVQRRVLFHSY